MMVDFSQKSDEELVAGSLKDPDFFSFLVLRYQDKLANYIKRLSSFSREDIEDLLQVIFLKCYLNLNSFDSSLKFSSWIYRIARNETINFYHHRKTRPPVDNFFKEEELADQSFAKLLKEIDLSLEVERLRVLISGLAVREREVLYLYFFAEQNYKEIADILKCPLGTVAAILSRAKKKIKNKYYEKFIRKSN